ncbi:hypothetical protein [Halospeciosus flavus]|uniref:DUF362 domain-containing protein n=1 Tax=Halospeciosus flavus TaxID=3032283 RepID=A0ABD5Z0Y3_9EURY|nr:hypothetical protein [Halospeciosus flavus]
MSPAVHVRRVPDLETESLASATDALVDALDTDLAGDSDAVERVLVVPDVHHPYHPSTGVVTNPAVLDVLLGRLFDAGHSVRVGVTDADAARYLGVDAVARDRDVDVVALADAECVTREAVQVPEPLVEDAVVALPTLRRDEAGAGEHPAGVGALCTSAVAAGGPALPASTAKSLVSPAVSFLDATYTPGTTPRESRGLLASADAGALDAVAADLLGVSSPESASTASSVDPAVHGAALASLRRDVADGVPEAAEPNDLLAAGYRLYARIVGDAVPPQFQRSAADSDGNGGDDA